MATLLELKAELNTLRTTSETIADLSQLYDNARHCQSLLLSCVQSMSDLPANRDLSMIKDFLAQSMMSFVFIMKQSSKK